MRTYKLFRRANDGLHPLYVLADQTVPLGRWLPAEIGPLADPTHVKARGSVLSLRPGWHSTEIPFTDWIGKRGEDGRLYQRPDTVWAECEVEGEEVQPEGRWGSRSIPSGWYYFRTNPRQERPWIISDRIKINRILSRGEVEKICAQAGVEAQPVWSE